MFIIILMDLILCRNSTLGVLCVPCFALCQSFDRALSHKSQGTIGMERYSYLVIFYSWFMKVDSMDKGKNPMCVAM